MTREARGAFEPGEGLTAAPTIRVGIGFGGNRVVSTSAIIDTGAEVCLFPEELFPWTLSGVRSGGMVLESAGGDARPIMVYYPSLTVGAIRVEGVASAVLPGSPSLLGRSFLNRLEIRLAARKDLVLLREST